MKTYFWFAAALLATAATAKPNLNQEDAEALTQIGKIALENANNPAMLVAQKPMKIVKSGVISLLTASIVPVAQFEVLSPPEDLKPPVENIENDDSTDLTNDLVEKEKEIIDQVNLNIDKSKEDSVELINDIFEANNINEEIMNIMEENQNNNIDKEHEPSEQDLAAAEQLLEQALQEQQEHIVPTHPTAEEIIGTENKETVPENDIKNSVENILPAEIVPETEENEPEENTEQQNTKEGENIVPENNVEQDTEQNVEENPEVSPEENKETKEEESSENIFSQMFHAVTNFFSPSEENTEDETLGEKVEDTEDINKGNLISLVANVEKIPEENNKTPVDPIIAKPENEESISGVQVEDFNIPDKINGNEILPETENPGETSLPEALPIPQPDTDEKIEENILPGEINENLNEIIPEEPIKENIPEETSEPEENEEKPVSLPEEIPSEFVPEEKPSESTPEEDAPVEIPSSPASEEKPNESKPEEDAPVDILSAPASEEKASESKPEEIPSSPASEEKPSESTPEENAPVEIPSSSEEKTPQENIPEEIPSEIIPEETSIAIPEETISTLEQHDTPEVDVPTESLVPEPTEGKYFGGGMYPGGPPYMPPYGAQAPYAPPYYPRPPPRYPTYGQYGGSPYGGSPYGMGGYGYPPHYPMPFRK